MKYNNSKGQVTAQVKLEDFERSGFDLDNVQYGTGRLGRLYPVRCDYVYPGDTKKAKSTAVLQFKPLAVPLMTDMHIKREDFYVPFNTVLDSFDDFISNGEDNDYNGVLPSKSLQQMVQDFYSYLLSGGESMQSGFIFQVFEEDHTGDNDVTNNWMKYKKYLGINYANPIYHGDTMIATSTGSYYRNFDYTGSAFFNSYVKPFMLEDLFYHVNPIIKQLDALISNARMSGVDAPFAGAGSVALFMPLSAVNISSAGIPAISTYAQYNSVIGNKYIGKIYKSLDKMVKSGILPADADSKYVPTETGFAFLRLMYELYKPLFGYSSNLDNMNYNMLKFEDFIYNVLCNIMIEQDYVEVSYGNHGFKYKYLQLPNNILNKKSPSVNVLSEKPQDILPLRALYSIWYNNYRDQLLETAAPKPNKRDTFNTEEVLILLCPRLRCWHKDAFTTALDNAGTGNVGVPLNAVLGAPSVLGLSQTSMFAPYKLKAFVGSLPNSEETILSDMQNVIHDGICEVTYDGTTYKVPNKYLTGLTPVLDASLDGDKDLLAPGFSLYQLDAAKRAQKFLQKALFYGNRIQDFLYTHFRVKFLDARLRLPEIIGSESSVVGMQQIMANNTIVTEQSTNVAGDRAGYASGAIESGINHYVPEHGVIISYLSVVPDCVYSNTFDRHHAMLDQFDFPFLEFATLGLQAVYENEMMQVPCKVDLGEGLTDSVAVHGYQGMYYADKSKFSSVHGELLDEDSFYVMDREFNPYDADTRPKLNYIFVHCHPKLDAFVVDNEWSDYFRYDIYHNDGTNRLLPVHSLYI